MNTRLPLLLAACLVSDVPAAEQWIPLFNGRNLDDWTPKFAGHAVGGNPGRVFRVEDGLLKVSYADVDEFDGSFGHMF